MSSVSGLDKQDRYKARTLVVKAAFLCLNHRPDVHYTQDLTKRWEGIRRDLKAFKGQYPHFCDCSSFATWCLWNGLDHFGIHDTVNGLAWRAGFTGTMLTHGKQVKHKENYLRGDCVLYGHGHPGSHTAIIVGAKGSTPYVVSHGSESGPHYLPYNYRSDIMQVRRYI